MGLGPQRRADGVIVPALRAVLHGPTNGRPLGADAAVRLVGKDAKPYLGVVG